jgi:hypothetical protein
VNLLAKKRDDVFTIHPKVKAIIWGFLWTKLAWRRATLKLPGYNPKYFLLGNVHVLGLEYRVPPEAFLSFFAQPVPYLQASTTE